MQAATAQRGIVLLVLATLVLSSLAFWLGRALGERAPASADTGSPTPAFDEDEATPAPGETPDPHDPSQLVKWLNADDLLPRYDQEVAGIIVGPDVTRRMPACEDNPPIDVPFEESRGTAVAISPRFLPADARRDGAFAVRCGEVVAFAEVSYRLPVAEDLQMRLDSGESYWDIPRGGSVQIFRFVGEPAEASSIAAARWYAGEVAGLPAAIGRPVLDEGLGDCEVMFYKDGVMTVVRAGNVSLVTAIEIAEGVTQ